MRVSTFFFTEKELVNIEFWKNLMACSIWFVFAKIVPSL